MKKTLLGLALLISATSFASEVSVNISGSDVYLTAPTDITVEEMDLKVSCISVSNARFLGDPLSGNKLKSEEISLKVSEVSEIEVDGQLSKQYLVSLDQDISFSEKRILKHNVHQCFLSLAFTFKERNLRKYSVFSKLIYNNYYSSEKLASLDLTDEFRAYMKGLAVEDLYNLTFEATNWKTNTWSYSVNSSK